MNLPRSTYYYRSKNKPDREQELLKRIEAVIEEFPGYGYRRVTRELHRQGFRDNHKKVLRIMKEHGLTKKPRRRWVCTTNSNHAHRVYPNLVHNLLVTGPNQLWVADLTYIGILSGFVYLAILLDLFARRVVGYALSQRIDTALCLEALRMAIAQRKPPAGVIHHSDRGVQYASGDYVEVLPQHGFRISMARKGNPYDNAAAESFIKTLKSEEVYLWEYRTMNDVQNRLPYFLEEVYNHKRLHSSIGYVPPVEFEEMFYQTNSCPVTLTASV
jgi:putative transposase